MRQLIQLVLAQIDALGHKEVAKAVEPDGKASEARLTLAFHLARHYFTPFLTASNYETNINI